MDGVDADQRGVTRPQGSGCDIGSVEIEPEHPAVSFDASAAGVRALAIGPVPYAEVSCTGEPSTADEEIPGVRVPGVAEVGGLTTTATGTRLDTELQSRATAHVEVIDLLSGLVHIEGASADATAVSSADEVESTGDAEFLRIRINGREIPTEVAANTTFRLGVGTLTLNKQQRSASGTTVTAVHLKLALVGDAVVIGQAAAHLPAWDSTCS